MDKQVVDSFKVISEITKLEPFDGNNFKCWKEKVFPILEFTEIDSVLHEPKPDDPQKLAKWLKINKLCTHTIKCGLANKLFDNYCHFTCAQGGQYRTRDCTGLVSGTIYFGYRLIPVYHFGFIAIFYYFIQYTKLYF